MWTYDHYLIFLFKLDFLCLWTIWFVLKSAEWSISLTASSSSESTSSLISATSSAWSAPWSTASSSKSTRISWISLHYFSITFWFITPFAFSSECEIVVAAFCTNPIAGFSKWTRLVIRWCRLTLWWISAVSTEFAFASECKVTLMTL